MGDRQSYCAVLVNVVLPREVYIAAAAAGITGGKGLLNVFGK